MANPNGGVGYRHGALVGNCGMVRKCAGLISTGASATDEARALAQQIVDLTYKLAEALKERR